MTRQKKIIISVTTIVAALFLIGSYFVGNYFIEYMLGRKDSDYDDALSPSYDKPAAEVENRQAANLAVAKLQAEVGFDEVYIQSRDGESLYGKIYVQPDSNLWAIVVHGYTSTHNSVQDVATEYYNRGYNVLTPDLRAHGNSSGEYIMLGHEDGPDIVEWAHYIDHADASIVLHGFSMGAATVMIAAGEDDLPENVVAVIEDSGYTTAIQMMKEQLKFRFGLPSFPIVNISNIISIVKTGLNFNDPKPIESIQNCDLPMLFIHGDEDNYVLQYMQMELYNSYQGEKDFLIIEGAGHTAGRYLVPDIYYTYVFDFLDKYVQ